MAGLHELITNDRDSKIMLNSFMSLLIEKFLTSLACTVANKLIILHVSLLPICFVCFLCEKHKINKRKRSISLLKRKPLHMLIKYTAAMIQIQIRLIFKFWRHFRNNFTLYFSCSSVTVDFLSLINFANYFLHTMSS